MAVALLVLPSAVRDVRHNVLLRAEDTRLLLGRWIESNVPPNSRMAVEGYSFVDARGRWLGPRKIPYRLEILPSLRSHPLEHYVKEKTDYLIVSSFVYGRYSLNRDAHAGSLESYRRMDAELPLAASFSPTDDGRDVGFVMDEEMTPIVTLFERDRPGPTVKVYRLGEVPEYGIEWLDSTVPAEAHVGGELAAEVALRNTGNLAWPPEGYTPVRVGYRWLDASGRDVPAPEIHSPLPRQVEPGESVVALVRIATPTVSGSYTLQIDLVWENFAWLSSKGAPVWESKVSVR